MYICLQINEKDGLTFEWTLKWPPIPFIIIAYKMHHTKSYKDDCDQH